MKIHHLNCGTDCPVGGALFDGRSLGPLGRLVCHCLLIETDAHGLVLVDTGYGLNDVAHPHQPPEPRIPPAPTMNERPLAGDRGPKADGPLSTRYERLAIAASSIRRSSR